jgi:4-alpha-glucanotransferase
MLPVGPTGYGDSPYSSESAFAGNPLLVALEPLVEQDLLSAGEADRAARPGSDHVHFEEVRPAREQCLRAAFAKFEAQPWRAPELARFSSREEDWLEDYVLYRAIKDSRGGQPWFAWPKELRSRDPLALVKARDELAREMRYHAFVQLEFETQWRELSEHAHARGIGLIGDVPIFAAHDSADVWAHPELFKLDQDGMPEVVAGVPPDYFSRTGQRWGNPPYAWKAHKKTGYAWWVRRIRAALERFDVVRLDHFIGFCRSWEIPASSPTAIEGGWRRGPGNELFVAVARALAEDGMAGLPLIAEDLGCTTRSVKALRDRFKLPGTKVLQFAFGSDPSAPDFLPHNYRRRSVVYTGTHDNDTIRGWFTRPSGDGSTSADDEGERRRACEYLGADGDEAVGWAFVRAALASVAATAILPLQDLLGLGSEARMNRPGTFEGNWSWRARPEDLSSELCERLASMTGTYGRAQDGPLK